VVGNIDKRSGRDRLVRSTVDVPMTERRRIGRGPGCGGVKQDTKAVGRIDVSEIRAMRPKLAEEWITIVLDVLPNHGDPEPWRREPFRRRRGAKLFEVARGRVAEGVNLMSRPEISRQLLGKSSRR